ncbi:hypothetical protein K239x_14920 [Planctomycetes bacterium K23_9]|uniref:Uncharacterized protein n=1 Tax=Stieleria marina TaxID=1930275 RepID=A0A517NQY7_9BACT|nr:hypothetical protein K239x_14920 [Planctomycetes bacterium K23_9]
MSFGWLPTNEERTRWRVRLANAWWSFIEIASAWPKIEFNAEEMRSERAGTFVALLSQLDVRYRSLASSVDNLRCPAAATFKVSHWHESCN